ncbi:RNB domain [Fragilaria crotonensis]|nr:RNB domain [Fragilaria crotonensis]
MTKKTISKIVKQVEDGPDRERAEDVLRKLLKAGQGMVRLVDSALAMDYLYEDDYPKTDIDLPFRRAVGGCAVSQDASLGGRFKRMACIFVSAEQSEDHNEVDSITFVNGGWLVVDSNVRSGAEARKFAQRTSGGSSGLLTAADERIAHRLECLAMGEIFGTMAEENELEVDVREYLKALDVPSTPEGAREALVRIGRWSQGQGKGKLEPWSSDTLYAAKEYAQADALRRQALASVYDRRDDVDLEGRADLTTLPAVCIDAKHTTFRDDAIGVRPRSATGRKVVPEASNWEVLIHIADVSDIYSPEQRFLDASTADFFKGCGLVLKSLGFVTHSPESAMSVKTPNRCVTLWAYIDERNGKVLDAGLERTLISTPLALTYESASMCLEQRDTLEKSHPLSKPSAILALAERNLQLWSNQYKQSSEAARKRENRLSAKEIVTQSRKQVFVRSRGHRLPPYLGLREVVRIAWDELRVHPLRRYVDGMAQRQALSVLCNYGGPPLTVDECQQVNAQANDAMDRLANLRPLKQKDQGPQRLVLAQLERKRNRVVKAICTGRGNEVSVDGAVGKCQGVQGRLPAGKVISVRVQTVHVEKGILIVELVK